MGSLHGDYIHATIRVRATCHGAFLSLRMKRIKSASWAVARTLMSVSPVAV